MTQLTGHTAFYELSNTLLHGIMAALISSIGGPLASGCVVPGAIAWDDCQCGAMYISTTNWFLSETFPEGGGPGTRTGQCELPWLVGDVTIQVMRCMPQPQGASISVPCDKLDAAAKIMLSDAYITLTSALRILCQLKEADTIIDFSLGQQTTEGPSGDCGGTELHVLIAIQR